MGNKTNIEWTDSTWNPIIGCSRVSEGCRNCYAEGIAGRFGQGKPTVYSGLTQIVNGRAVWTGHIKETRKLLEPLSWKKPRKVLVNSMSDLFHENVTDEMRDRIFAVMGHCSVRWYRCTKRGCDHDACDENFLRPMEPHVFQVLTKRPERMSAYLNAPGRWDAIKEAWDSVGWYFSNPPIEDAVWPLPNVWLGVSVENQAAADDRIESLLRTPAAVRFLSVEPMLGPINLNWVGCECDESDSWDGVIDSLGGFTWIEEWDNADGSERTVKRCQTVPKIDWVICGGESGPGARPMHQDWARSLRDQCQAAGVPFFFKQWGEWWPVEPTPGLRARATMPGQNSDVFAWPDGTREGWKQGKMSLRIGKHTAGAVLDGREWKEFPR